MTNTPEFDRFGSFNWRIESVVSAAHVLSRETLGKVIGNYGEEADPEQIDLMKALNTLQTLEFVVSEAYHGVVKRAREEGATWEQIGDALHTTRQAAQQRFGR